MTRVAGMACMPGRCVASNAGYQHVLHCGRCQHRYRDAWRPRHVRHGRSARHQSVAARNIHCRRGAAARRERAPCLGRRITFRQDWLQADCSSRQLFKSETTSLSIAPKRQRQLYKACASRGLSLRQSRRCDAARSSVIDTRARHDSRTQNHARIAATPWAPWPCACARVAGPCPPMAYTGNPASTIVCSKPAQPRGARPG